MTTATRDELITLTAAAGAAYGLASDHRDKAGRAMQHAAGASDTMRQVYLDQAEHEAAEARAAELEARHLGNEFVRAHEVTR